MIWLEFSKWKFYWCFWLQSVSLWCDYLNFVQEYDPSVRDRSATGISKARNLFERALTAAGLHVTEGHRIWELYREFEQANFSSIAESDTGVRISVVIQLSFEWGIRLQLIVVELWLFIMQKYTCRNLYVLWLSGLFLLLYSWCCYTTIRVYWLLRLE